MSRFVSSGLLVGLLAMTAPAVSVATPVYSDFMADIQNVIYFGSGVLTGAPDDGGAFLSNTYDPPTLLGHITAGFSTGLIDGAGVDIVIHDAYENEPASNEFADIFVSSDGSAFTYLGAYGNGINSFDLNGVFGGTVSYVKIVNTSTVNSPDIDAFQGNYAGTAPVPEPATCLLLGAGLVAAAGRRLRKRA
jgi:hypothetical protein